MMPVVLSDVDLWYDHSTMTQAKDYTVVVWLIT